MKDKPVSSYDSKAGEPKTISQQDEIIFEENSYRAPDINFLSQPEQSKDNSINQEELTLNAEKLKNVLIDFKIE